ncbi:hypothetical protein, partial [Thiolapillus sp.]|uniref:hypothetical protein n=1 Tax=Thiolapillus sp. TaxID=2017437 RepID=UPI003AF66665
MNAQFRYRLLIWICLNIGKAQDLKGSSVIGGIPRRLMVKDGGCGDERNQKAQFDIHTSDLYLFKY